MNFPESVDRKTVVKVIACVDIVQPLFLIFLRGKDIVIRSKVDDENPLRLNQSSTVLVVRFVVIACFLLIHLTMALKLIIATEQMNNEILSAARHAKVWQNWSIVYLILLIAHIFSNILSAQSKLYIVLETVGGIVEISWRLFAIYNVGKFIDDILFNFPSMAPTVQFFAVSAIVLFFLSEMRISSDLWYRKTNAQVIALVDIILAILAIFYTSWGLLNNIYKISKHSLKIDINELGILFSTFLSILFTTFQLFIARRLITETNKISEKPKHAFKGCLLWIKYSTFLLLLLLICMAYFIYQIDFQTYKIDFFLIGFEILFRGFAMLYILMFTIDLARLVKSCKKNSEIHIFADGDSQNTTIIQISDYSDISTPNSP